MKNLQRILLFLILAGLWSAASQAALIHVFGDRDSDRANLVATLTSQGHTVTSTLNLASDLSLFDTIWHVGAFDPITAAEQSLMAGFLAGGGGIHLTGERPCCESLNASLQTFVNSVVIGGGITVGGQGDVGGAYAFNTNTVAGVGAGLGSWNANAAGGMGGLGVVPNPNILASGAGGAAVGAAWDSADLVGHSGRLSLLMDVNWFSNSGRDAPIASIEDFLEGAGSVVSTDVPAPGALALVCLGLLALPRGQRFSHLLRT